MFVYCTDGTVFECKRYEVTEYGLQLYGTEEPKEKDRYDDDEPSQIGFVPHDRLWYVLPRGVTPQVGLTPPQGQATQAPQTGQGRPPGQPADQIQQPRTNPGNGSQGTRN